MGALGGRLRQPRCGASGSRALASFAAGLAWWASGLMLVGLPLTAAAVVVAWRQRRRAALVVSLVVLVGWVTFWMLILAVFLSA